ncbi:unnamed protein product, partial [Ectocarpus sp. 12 AP-2014]
LLPLTTPSWARYTPSTNKDSSVPSSSRMVSPWEVSFRRVPPVAHFGVQLVLGLSWREALLKSSVDDPGRLPRFHGKHGELDFGGGLRASCTRGTCPLARRKSRSRSHRMIPHCQ